MPIALLLLVVPALVTTIIAVRRRAWLAAAAGAALAVSGLPLALPTTRPANVAVFVDLNPGTRTAAFRDDALLAKWLRDHDLDDAEVTTFRGPIPAVAAGAIVLFTDGRAEMPHPMPPTIVVLDPALDDPDDAAVVAVKPIGDGVAAEVHADETRNVSVAGGRADRAIVAGEGVVAIEPTGGPIRVAVAPGDAWPENDALTAPPPGGAERWWAAGGPAPAGFRQMLPLPDDPAAWAAAGVVVTNRQHPAIDAYVRDLGGGVVLLQDATTLGLSPLSPFPPEPRRAWRVLLDVSGSMNRNDRLAKGLAALSAARAALPGRADVAFGTFAADVTWHGAEPPTAADAGGPTGLSRAVTSLAANLPRPTEALLLTDGAGELAGDEAQVLAAARVRLHVVALAPLPPAHPLRRLAEATGGGVTDAGGDWATAARRATARAAGLGDTTPATVQIPPNPPRQADVWPAHLQAGAELVAAAGGRPAAAVWRRGLGSAAAVAFDPTPDEAAALANLVAGAASDPCYQLDVEDGPMLRLTLRGPEAADVTFAAGTAKLAAEEIAPGTYYVELPRPPAPTAVIAIVGGEPVARAPVAGGYGPEFARIGNDWPRARTHAQRTGGYPKIVGDDRPLRLPEIPRRSALGPWLALAAAALAAAALATAFFRPRL